MDPLFVALFSFTVFIAGGVSAATGFAVARIVQKLESSAATSSAATVPAVVTPAS